MLYPFSVVSLRAANEGAIKFIDEVRPQFKIPGVMGGTTQLKYAHVVDLTTQNALKSMLAPTLVTIPVSIFLGFRFAPLTLAVI